MDGWMHVHLPTAFRRPMPVARLYDMLYARTVIDEGKKDFAHQTADRFRLAEYNACKKERFENPIQSIKLWSQALLLLFYFFLPNVKGEPMSVPRSLMPRAFSIREILVWSGAAVPFS